MTKHSPEILTGLGIAGMVSTTVLAVKATPKAIKLIEIRKEELQLEDGKLKPIETIKTTWKCYIPAAVTGSVSIACLVGANSMHLKRNTALAAAYKLSETALTEYREQVIETIGEKKEQAVRDKVAEKRLEKNPVEQNEVVASKKGGTTLCYDYMTDRYFESEIETIKKGLNRLNATMLRDDTVSLNDFYDEIGLPHAGIGDEFGWNASTVGRNLIELSISYGPAGETDRPCAIIAFNPMPHPGYDDYH
jgi:hypothetical protein